MYGEFNSGKKHGQGTFTSPDGDKYVGEFKDGKISWSRNTNSHLMETSM